MSTQFFRLLAMLVVCAALGACSWFRDKPPEYMESREVPPLSVPDEFDPLRYQTPLLITADGIRMPSGDELEPGPPRVVNTAGRADSNAYMAWSAQGVYLAVADSPASVQRRLGFAIDRVGMRPLETDEPFAQRFEYVHIRYDERSFWEKLAFWNNSKGPDFSGFYTTRVEADGEEARVYLYLDSDTPATTSAAEHILGIFMERLG
jgi:uncharacterized lipoprotein